ncbi:hypothetical protein VM1G_08061 [Cytospora mali]|uniref:Uncharacterized protein n=1 Tax=Cytospora mali TaxID=578113 RepID=A0A194W6S9_CYTMA|nr:hypothetical protein VM1G_08061 [Valsa mali]
MPHAEEEQPNGHSFWDQDAVPGENDNDFKPFKSREYTGAAGIFRPKDEHCGIWHSPPNKRCYASFGDQGTTASVGCYGNLVRMIQYLGVGHSGVFSLDQTDEPYNIKLRAEQLDDLSADIHTGNYTLEFPPSGDLSRNEPLEVKWVNWRWPRYEYETSHPGVKALIQWIVHKNIVLQQLVLENASEKSVKVVSTLNTNMKTQDLDFLDRRYPIDYDEEGDYTHGMGPKGYGHIYVHALRDDNSSSLKEVHSVASVTALFVNGEAVKMGDGPEIQNHHTLEGQSSVEMVVAYKMITIPASKVDWRNFLVTAEEADVSSILRKESDELWKSAGDISLCSLGLSTIDLTGPMRKAREGTDAGDEGNKGMKSAGRKAPNGMAVSENKKVEGTSTANKGDADTETSMDAKGADPGPSMPSKTERFGFPSGTPDKTSPRNHIEYLAWRHLEHILSVCAVPLSAPQLYENNTCSNTDDIIPVALTRGDLYDHGISTSASFFAFQFLVDVARRLERFERKIPYILRLEQRIKAVCRGHMKWLERLLMADQPRLLKSGCFTANYWVTGELHPKSDDIWGPWQPTDTAYQILKMTDYGSFYNDKQMVRHLLEKVRVSWLEELNKLDKRASFAWPHAREGGINIFRLDDHFWVWKSLKSMEDFGIVEVGLERTARIAERLVPSKVRRGILENFTTENDVSRKRMLAVTRSARETRFLFHSRDTALFYGYGCGFFVRGSSFDELWKNTIEAQPHHEENEEVGWEKALRYALGIMLGTQGYCLDKQEPAALAKRCVEVLIGSGGHNGFLPGLLDEETKKPARFWSIQNKHFLYYDDSFEIHHILLTHARRIDGLFQEPIASSQKPQSPDIEQAQKPSNEQDELLHRLFSQMAESNLALTAQPKRQVMMDHPRDQTSDFIINPLDIAPRRNRGRSLTMKKLLPINSLIDVSSIVNLEEEWLYNYPEFLSTEDVDLEKRINSIITSGRFNSDESEGIIADILKKHRCSKKSFSVSLWGVFRVDTPKQKHIGRRQDVRWNPLPLGVGHWMMPSCEFFGAARTAESAKKRFIWLPEATDDYALVCWMASPETEKSAMALFFDRHSKQENHVWDDTTMVLNTWQTELHLSFFVLADASTPKYNGLPPLIKDPFPGRPKKEIRRASIGFRFDGDFFDRYWTCHLIEYY